MIAGIVAGILFLIVIAIMLFLFAKSEKQSPSEDIGGGESELGTEEMEDQSPDDTLSGEFINPVNTFSDDGHNDIFVQDNFFDDLEESGPLFIDF
jgi:hypothetical protein